MAGESTRASMAAFYNGTKQPPLESWEACKADPSHILVHHLALCKECTQLRNKSCGYQTDAACTHLCHASWHKFVPTLLTVFWSQLALGRTHLRHPRRRRAVGCYQLAQRRVWTRGNWTAERWARLCRENKQPGAGPRHPLPPFQRARNLLDVSYSARGKATQ